MVMLGVFAFLDADFVPDGRQLQLDALAKHPDEIILREGFFEAHDNIIRLIGVGQDFVNTTYIPKLRDIDILTLYAASDESVMASFDLSKESVTNALFSLFTTLSVTMLLAILSCLFSRDAFQIMILPIEKMKSTVQKAS